MASGYRCPSWSRPCSIAYIPPHFREHPNNELPRSCPRGRPARPLNGNLRDGFQSEPTKRQGALCPRNEKVSCPYIGPTPKQAVGAAPSSSSDDAAPSKQSEEPSPSNASGATPSEAPPQPPTSASPSKSSGVVSGRLLGALVILLVAAGYVAYTNFVGNETLSVFNGDGGYPVYLSILGEVFDVTAGQRYYGKNGSYNFFVGKDASRAFVTGDFKGDLVEDCSDLLNEQLASISYTPRGKLIGVFFNKDGSPTEKLAKVLEGAAAAKSYEERRRENDAKYPKCNIRWSEKEGGFAWCSDDMYPRKLHILEEDNTPTTRCACFEQIGWSDLRELYPGCKPNSNSCQVSPPGKAPPRKPAKAKLQADAEADELQAWEGIMNVQGVATEVLIHHSIFDMRRSDLMRLQIGTWLNDDVINFYFFLMRERDTRTQNFPRCHFFSSFFLTRLLGTNGQRDRKCNYEAVKRLTSKPALRAAGQASKSILSVDWIMIPVNGNNNTHWTCAVIDIPAKELVYYDSYGASWLGVVGC
eukprot:gene24445-10045_t